MAARTLMTVDTEEPSVQIGPLRLIRVESVGGKVRVQARGTPVGHGPLFGNLTMDEQEWDELVEAFTFLAVGCQCHRCLQDRREKQVIPNES